MSDIRKKGVEYLKNAFGYESSELIAVSKLYEAEESWTKNPTYWFDLPVEKIETRLDKNYFLIGENKDDGFTVLRVPNRFLWDNITKFDTDYDNAIRLHLAAYRENWLVDERLKENGVNFVSFELE